VGQGLPQPELLSARDLGMFWGHPGVLPSPQDLLRHPGVLPMYYLMVLSCPLDMM